MIKNIIFDFDGVIVDSEVLASKAFSKYFSKFDQSIKEEQFYKYAGKKTVEVIDLLSSKYKIENKEKFTNEIFDIVSEVYSKDLKLVDGAKDYISKSDRNHYIGSNSNKDRIIAGLRFVGLDKFFFSNQVYSFDFLILNKIKFYFFIKAFAVINIRKNKEATHTIEGPVGVSNK